MSAPRPNGRPVDPQILPEQVVKNLGHAEEHYRMFMELTKEATTLESEIDAAQAALDKMKARHRRLGFDVPEQDTLARAYHEMAVDHCKKYGYGPMPPSFEELAAHLAQQVERISPVATGALDTVASPVAQLDPLTDPAFRAVS